MDIRSLKKFIDEIELPDEKQKEAKGKLCSALVEIISLKFFCDQWDSIDNNLKAVLKSASKEDLEIIEGSFDLFPKGFVFSVPVVDFKNIVLNSNRLGDDLSKIIDKLGPYSQDVFNRLNTKQDIKSLHNKNILSTVCGELIKEDLSSWSKDKLYDLLRDLIDLSYTYTPADAEDTVTPRDVANLQSRQIDITRLSKSEPVLIADQTDYSGTILVAMRDYLESQGFEVSVFSYGKSNDLARLMLLLKYGQNKVTIEASLEVDKKKGKLGAYDLQPENVPNRFDIIAIDQPQNELQAPMWYQLRKLLKNNGQMICLANGSPLYANDALPKQKNKSNKGPFAQLVEQGYVKKICQLGKDVSYSTNIDQYLILIDNAGAKPDRPIMVQNLSSYRTPIKHTFDNKKQEFTDSKIEEIIALDSLPQIPDISTKIHPQRTLTQDWKIVKADGEKDIETTPYSPLESEQQNYLTNHLNHWGVQLGTKKSEKAQVKCSINFNKIFYKSPELMAIEDIEADLDNINEMLYNLDKDLKEARK